MTGVDEAEPAGFQIQHALEGGNEYLEQICVNGITFRYGEDGRPVKMCACKKLIYITTAGGFLLAGSALERYMEELCGLLCIPEIRFIKADGLDIQGNDPDQIMREAIAGI